MCGDSRSEIETKSLAGPMSRKTIVKGSIKEMMWISLISLQDGACKKGKSYGS